MSDSSELQFYISQAVNGIANGCLYGLLALSIVYIYRAARVGNFAQAEMSTFSVFMLITFLAYMPAVLAFILTLLLTFVMGASIHLMIIRKIRDKEKVDIELCELIITIGLLLIFNSMTRWIWSSKFRTLPSPLPDGSFTFGEVIVTYHSLLIVLSTLLIGILLYLFFNFTQWGRASEANSENRLAASLKGIPIHHMLSLSWGIAAIIGAIAGILAAPKINVHPNMMSSVFVYSYTAAVLGGLKSPLGALLAGVVVGVTENLAGTIPMVGSELKTVVVFVLLVLVLYLRPRGMFGRREVRKV